MSNNMLTAINGITIKRARLIASIEFGDDLIKVILNEEKNIFNIYVKKPVNIIDKNSLIKFSWMWSGTFDVITIDRCSSNEDIEKARIEKIRQMARKKTNPVITKWRDPFLTEFKK